MGAKVKNRGWVKDAAIIFLVVLLFLTFFSNTIMNRSLPEVATQMVQSGAITAKVRGSGTVIANSNYEVVAGSTRKIQTVMIKKGQTVNAGDVLFILGEGASEELEAAQEQLSNLQRSYQRSALSMPSFDYAAQEKEIRNVQKELEELKKTEQDAKDKLEKGSGIPQADIDAANAKLKAAQATLDKLNAAAELKHAEAQQRLDKALEAWAALETAPGAPSTGKAETPPAVTEGGEGEIPSEGTEGGEGGTAPEGTEGSEGEAPPTETPAPPMTEKEKARKELEDAQAALEALAEPDPAIEAAKMSVAQYQDELNKLVGVGNGLGEAYIQAVEAREECESRLSDLQHSLEQEKLNNSKTLSLASLDLQDISEQIEKQKKIVLELSGGEENEVVASVSGTIDTIYYTAGQTPQKGEVLCTIEVPDMGYELSFSVTNDQARRLHVGDTATVSNFYWGSKITATLESIKPDPKNPQGSKILVFNVSGDVSAGSELTVSVGSKSANYDYIVPNTALRTDSNGTFVLLITAKNSPLGNRYIATRVDVEVIASDELNSAINGEFGWGEYVITTSNRPIENGDQVRMPD